MTDSDKRRDLIWHAFLFVITLVLFSFLCGQPLLGLISALIVTGVSLSQRYIIRRPKE